MRRTIIWIMLDYDETQEDPIFENDDFVTSDREA
jgi:hypothetical protein